MPVGQMNKTDTKTMKAGVLGWPVKHSLSPRLHHFWLQKYKIEGTYEAMAVKPEEVKKVLRNLPDQKFSGVNLTIPHKEIAVEVVDHLHSFAKRIGAENMVVIRKDGTLEGRNTDAYGFTQNLLCAGFASDERPITVLGAGGVARAVIAALLDMGFTDIRIVNRTRNRAEMLANTFSKTKISIFGWSDTHFLKDSILLVNATSLGLHGQPPLELSLDRLPDDAWVNDLVYVPLMTELLKRAQARGNKIVDGLGMLLHQARPAFSAFFGMEPEVTDDLRSFVLRACE